ncbi:MAG TPA: hypothetical protein VFQ36_13370 [Ktedonobacteraceae bacterium]|nr:hypothetical protein [Ktedonobacteraceae bacterium]
MSRKKNSKPGNILWGALIGLLVVLAVRDQLRLPPEERTWHGSVAGIVPYDFRRPTFERIRATFWNKDTAQILVPQAFGVGWAINFYPLLHPATARNVE